MDTKSINDKIVNSPIFENYKIVSTSHSNFTKRLAIYPADEILDQTIQFQTRIDGRVYENKTKSDNVHLGSDGNDYKYKLSSLRYDVFKKSKVCACCGIVGTHMILETNHDNITSAHFNLYAKVGSHLVLMTKDHILPKSKNGKDILENMQTMCGVCNNIKSDSHISTEELKNSGDIQWWFSKIEEMKMDYFTCSTCGHHLSQCSGMGPCSEELKNEQ